MKEIIILRKLYAEIRKWKNQRGITSSTIMSRTSRLFIENVVNCGSFVYEQLQNCTSEQLQNCTPEQLQNCTPELQNCTPTTAKLHCNFGEFHLFNKYIKDLSNIPSGGIACAHASDSSGVAQSVPQKVSPMVNNLLRNPEMKKKIIPRRPVSPMRLQLISCAASGSMGVPPAACLKSHLSRNYSANPIYF